MVLVAPELEVQISQLPKLVLRESIAAVMARVNNAESLPFSPFQRFGHLAALCS